MFNAHVHPGELAGGDPARSRRRRRCRRCRRRRRACISTKNFMGRRSRWPTSCTGGSTVFARMRADSMAAAIERRAATTCCLEPTARCRPTTRRRPATGACCSSPSPAASIEHLAAQPGRARGRHHAGTGRQRVAVRRATSRSTASDVRDVEPRYLDFPFHIDGRGRTATTGRGRPRPRPDLQVLFTEPGRARQPAGLRLRAEAARVRADQRGARRRHAGCS